MDPLKKAATEQWNSTPCGSTDVHQDIQKESLEYFQALRNSRFEVTDTWMKEKIPFHLGKGKKVLEIGFGQGSDLFTWHEAGADCYGIDITPEHFRLAQLHFALNGKKANLQLADAANIPFPSDQFDIVYSNGVLHHTPDIIKCISECHRVLKPGGQMIFSMYRTYSAFHIITKLLVEGILKGKLKTLGYQGLLSTIERGADGIHIKPLVKTYRATQLKHMLSDFSKVEFKVAHFKREHLTKFHRLVPRFAEKYLEPLLGWYLIAYTIK